MKDLVWNVVKLAGSPNLADYFPILESLDPQGISKQFNTHCEKFFAIFDRLIDEKLKSRGQTNDLLDSLIDMNQRDETEMSRDEIKHLLLLEMSPKKSHTRLVYPNFSDAVVDVRINSSEMQKG
ncbi:hypothetical protein ACS0TY_019539 [Phlomoides rotata]